MSTGKLSSTLLLLLLFCVKYSHSGVKKIKIHVPYYVKHVHHYKKVYVPKIHVIKHEHHHKKEYDHHHHHHEVFKHSPYRSYDKSSHEYTDEYAPREVYYDDIESKSYRGNVGRRARPIKYLGRYSQQFKAWKDVDGSDYSGEEEEDYSGRLELRDLRNEAYRKNYYFKRRSGSAEEDEEGQDKDREEESVEEEDEDEEEQEEEQEEEEDVGTNDSTTSRDIISLTTTSTPLLRSV